MALIGKFLTSVASGVNFRLKLLDKINSPSGNMVVLKIAPIYRKKRHGVKKNSSRAFFPLNQGK
jgi:hypothetical protein